jgi:hypothetical protein
MHVAPGTSNPQNVQHAIQKSPIVIGWTGLASMLRWQEWLNNPPFCIAQIPTGHLNLLKRRLESFSRCDVNRQADIIS